MRRLVRQKNKYPPRVRGRTGKISEREHELYGRYMWEIEIFCVPASGKITILKTLQSLWFGKEKSFVDEFKAEKALRNNIDLVEAAIEKTTKLTGVNKSGLLLPGGLE